MPQWLYHSLFHVMCKLVISRDFLRTCSLATGIVT